MNQPTLRRISRHACSVIGFAFAIGALGAIAADATTGSPTSGATAPASRPTDELVSKFTTFAGSTANAQALVDGLRSGGDITLQSTTPTVPDATFNAPTAPMGFGNIKIALSLAQAQLSAQGITQPTPAQIETALLGGSLNAPNGTVDVPGVLAMRSAGQGWGEIAHALGFKVGDLMRNEKAHPVDKNVGTAEVPKPQRAERSERAERTERGADRTERAERPERAERAERPERPEKIERVSRVDRPERVERVERVERPERPERPERVERPERPERAERPERGNP
jgi:hypothetical protein